MVSLARFSLLLAFSASSMASQLGIDSVSPNEVAFGKEMTQIQKKAQDSALDVLNNGSLEWAKKDELQATGVLDLQLNEVKNAKPVDDFKPKGENYVVFVSWSLGESYLKDLMREYNGSKLVTLLFRGIPDGLSMAQALTKIQELSRATKSDVSVEINPVTFLDNNVTHVPALIKREGDKVLSVVRGTSSIDLFKAKPGMKDLGLVGEVRDITERDLIDVMKERMAKLDVKKLKEGAVSRFWANQQFQILDVAQESKTRKLDPTIVVPEDMVAPDGTLIHAAGTLINPLGIRPFNQRLVVIDPSFEWQLTLARAQIARFGRDQLVTIILTSVPRDSGWDELKKIEKYLDQPAYLLPAEVKARFDLKATPSIVTADTDSFYIKEVAQKDSEK